MGIVPDYVSLLGTIHACQQQKSAFRWSLLYEAVEDKIHKALAIFEDSEDERETTEALSQLVPEAWNLSNFRPLQLSVLQGLFMWLQSLQSFPEHGRLHLKCRTGISTVVVWCHHVLGLSLTINILQRQISFGDAPYNLIIEQSYDLAGTVSLMDPLDSQEPLFTLQDDRHPGNSFLKSNFFVDTNNSSLPSPHHLVSNLNTTVPPHIARNPSPPSWTTFLCQQLCLAFISPSLFPSSISRLADVPPGFLLPHLHLLSIQ